MAVIVGPPSAGLGCFLCSTVPLACEFAFSLQVSAALAADSVLEVAHAVNAISPADEDRWEANVVTPALALANGPIHLLSNGWGRGLALCYVGLWSAAIAAIFTFCRHLLIVLSAPSVGRINTLLFNATAMLTLLGMPLAISQAVAAVSTSCDDLGESINQRRIENLDTGARLMQLELALQNLNNRQGLGFVMFDSVLDKKKLRTIYGAVAGMFATLVPLIVAFNTGSSDGVIYGSFAGSEMVYAYNPLGRPQDAAEAFCEKLWMFPASLDPSAVTEEEIFAVLNGLAGLGSASLGAFRGEAPGTMVWADGTPWTRRTVCSTPLLSSCLQSFRRSASSFSI
jgi:hypothetical protein